MRILCAFFLTGITVTAFTASTKDVESSYKGYSGERVDEKLKQIVHDVKACDAQRKTEWDRFSAIGKRTMPDTDNH